MKIKNTLDIPNYAKSYLSNIYERLHHGLEECLISDESIDLTQDQSYLIKDYIK